MANLKAIRTGSVRQETPRKITEACVWWRQQSAGPGTWCCAPGPCSPDRWPRMLKISVAGFASRCQQHAAAEPGATRVRHYHPGGGGSADRASCGGYNGQHHQAHRTAFFAELKNSGSFTVEPGLIGRKAHRPISRTALPDPLTSPLWRQVPTGSRGRKIGDDDSRRFLSEAPTELKMNLHEIRPTW